MKFKSLVVFCLLISPGIFTMSTAADRPGSEESIPDALDLQGHRGARGLLPENTIPAFLHAVDIGVNTLEMDVVINAQGHVVVSHEPWMSAKICSNAHGRKISRKEEKSLKIYNMSDAEVASFDCGSRGHPDFPRQQALSVSKPLLTDVLQAVAEHTARPVRFNIEIKSRPEYDLVFHPEVRKYTAALYRVLKVHDVLEHSSIQSFDPRALEAIHTIDPGVATVFLIDNRKGLQTNLARLSFVPDIYSPYYKRVDKKTVRAAHNQGIRVIPWTVNDAKAMRKLVAMGVDGLITDYPDIGVRVLLQNVELP